MYSSSATTKLDWTEMTMTTKRCQLRRIRVSAAMAKAFCADYLPSSILSIDEDNDNNLGSLGTEYITDIRIVIGEPDRTPIQASLRRLNSNQLCRMHHPHASEPQVPHSPRAVLVLRFSLSHPVISLCSLTLTLPPAELLLPELPTRPSASKTWNDALPVSSHHPHLISRLPVRLLHLGRS